jgi:hypothetical protein
MAFIIKKCILFSNSVINKPNLSKYIEENSKNIKIDESEENKIAVRYLLILASENKKQSFKKEIQEFKKKIHQQKKTINTLKECGISTLHNERNIMLYKEYVEILEYELKKNI